MKRNLWVIGVGMLAVCVTFSGCAVITIVPVPNVVGQTQATAELAIISIGLTVGTVTEAYSDTVAAGQVLSQDPEAGASVAPGTAVNLVMSKGLETETVILPGDVPLVMVWIPGGTFTMGSPDEDVFSKHEKPEHTVTVSGFWMGKYELTKRQWQAVKDTAPWTGKPYVLADLDSPAVYVSWDDAQSFIATLNAWTGKAFRLPSEAEWEYACRAGTSTSFYWNDVGGDISDYAWYGEYAQGHELYAHVVGQKLPNAFGLYDMSGNVWEYCQDYWHFNYDGAPTDGSAWEFPVDIFRIRRGGSWADLDDPCRSAYRGMLSNELHEALGFRLAR